MQSLINEMLTQIVIYRLKVLVQYLSLYLSTVPSNIESIQDQDVTEGDNLTLTCSATGVPQPKVSWIKPGGHRHNGHTLEVTHIKRGQTGEYKCETSSECGNAIETATIHVLCKCVDSLLLFTVVTLNLRS